MGDRKIKGPTYAIEQITAELKAALNDAKKKLKGSERRQFMAQIVESLGPGGQRRAQRPVCQAEGNTKRDVIARLVWTLRGRRSWHVRKHYEREPGDPIFVSR